MTALVPCRALSENISISTGCCGYLLRWCWSWICRRQLGHPGATDASRLWTRPRPTCDDLQARYVLLIYDHLPLFKQLSLLHRPSLSRLCVLSPPRIVRVSDAPSLRRPGRLRRSSKSTGSGCRSNPWIRTNRASTFGRTVPELEGARPWYPQLRGRSSRVRLDRR